MCWYADVTLTHTLWFNRRVVAIGRRTAICLNVQLTENDCFGFVTQKLQNRMEKTKSKIVGISNSISRKYDKNDPTFRKESYYRVSHSALVIFRPPF